MFPNCHIFKVFFEKFVTIWGHIKSSKKTILSEIMRRFRLHGPDRYLCNFWEFFQIVTVFWKYSRIFNTDFYYEISSESKYNSVFYLSSYFHKKWNTPNKGAKFQWHSVRINFLLQKWELLECAKKRTRSNFDFQDGNGLEQQNQIVGQQPEYRLVIPLYPEITVFL